MKYITHHRITGLTVVLITSLALGGCAATWSTSDVSNLRPTDTPSAASQPITIVITEGDITERKYSVLGDISVTVNKITMFHPDPTRDQVNERLREEAAKLDADAIIFVRYGTLGISVLSWGSLDGKGRAIKFTR